MPLVISESQFLEERTVAKISVPCQLLEIKV